MGYKVLVLLQAILFVLPKRVRYRFFLLLAHLGYLLAAKHRRIAQTNLTFLFGKSLSKAQKDEIVRYSFKNLALNLFYIMELQRISKEELSKIVEVKNLHYVKEAMAKGRGIVYISGHYGVWELEVASISAFARETAIVYKHLKNREYEAWLLHARERFGSYCIQKSGVVRKLVKIAQAKRDSYILIDTNIGKKEGVEVEFFGKKIHQSATPAYLARKHNALIIPLAIHNRDDMHFTLEFYEPIEIEPSDDVQDDIAKLSQKMATWLEELVRKEPKPWFWLHRRFKGDYPHLYRRC